MNVQADCRFHGVGQGLFYSASVFFDGEKNSTLDSFRFIYDCGTTGAEELPLLHAEIDRECNCMPCELDALFISHFHRDHISGIPYLLKRMRVKNVFFPCFSPESMWLLRELTSEEAYAEDLEELYRNPVRYFARHGVRRVYVVYPEGEELSAIAESYSQEDTPLRIDGRAHYLGNASGVETFGIAGSFAVQVKSGWEFRIYEAETKEMRQSLQEKILAFFPETDGMGERIFAERSTRKKVQAVYQEVVGEMNQSSLVLYHGPMSEGRVIAGKGYYSAGDCFDRCHNCHDFEPGTLLTGDIDLCSLAQLDKRFPRFMEGKRFGVFLLPHHGSKHNTNLAALKRWRMHPLYVCSYGIGNRFHHPDEYLLLDIAKELEAPLARVFQKSGLTYFVESNKNEA